MSRRPLIAVLAAAASLAAAAPGAQAAAPKPLVLGTADPGYASSDAERRNRLYDETLKADAGVVRISAFWFAIAPEKPALLDPFPATDPRNGAYVWGDLDAAVRGARSRGLEAHPHLAACAELGRGPRTSPPDSPRACWDPTRSISATSPKRSPPATPGRSHPP